MKSVDKNEKEVDINNNIYGDKFSKANSFMIFNANSNEKNEINIVNEINKKYYDNDNNKIEIDLQNKEGLLFIYIIFRVFKK